MDRDKLRATLKEMACERCHNPHNATYSGIVTGYRFCVECLLKYDVRDWEQWFRDHPKPLVRSIGWHEYDE